MLLTIDGTFLIQVLNLIVFWVLLNFLFIRPTRRAIEARQRHISGLHSEAEAFAARAAALQGEADALLSDARRMTDELMRAASARASDEVHAIERDAANEAAAQVQLAHATVAAERSQAMQQQRVFVHELARTMLQRASGFESVT